MNMISQEKAKQILYFLNFNKSKSFKLEINELSGNNYIQKLKHAIFKKSKAPLLLRKIGKRDTDLTNKHYIDSLKFIHLLFKHYHLISKASKTVYKYQPNHNIFKLEIWAPIIDEYHLLVLGHIKPINILSIHCHISDSTLQVLSYLSIFDKIQALCLKVTSPNSYHLERLILKLENLLDLNFSIVSNLNLPENIQTIERFFHEIRKIKALKLLKIDIKDPFRQSSRYKLNLNILGESLITLKSLKTLELNYEDSLASKMDYRSLGVYIGKLQWLESLSLQLVINSEENYFILTKNFSKLLKLKVLKIFAEPHGTPMFSRDIEGIMNKNMNLTRFHWFLHPPALSSEKIEILKQFNIYSKSCLRNLQELVLSIRVENWDVICCSLIKDSYKSLLGLEILMLELDFGNIKNEFAEDLISMLAFQQNVKILKLNIRYDSLNDDILALIGRSIAKITQLTNLKINIASKIGAFSDNGIKSLCKMIRQLKMLEKIAFNISNKGLSVESLYEICNSITLIGSLRKISIGIYAFIHVEAENLRLILRKMCDRNRKLNQILIEFLKEKPRNSVKSLEMWIESYGYHESESIVDEAEMDFCILSIIKYLNKINFNDDFRMEWFAECSTFDLIRSIKMKLRKKYDVFLKKLC